MGNQLGSGKNEAQALFKNSKKWDKPETKKNKRGVLMGMSGVRVKDPTEVLGKDWPRYCS